MEQCHSCNFSTGCTHSVEQAQVASSERRDQTTVVLISRWGHWPCDKWTPIPCCAFGIGSPVNQRFQGQAQLEVGISALSGAGNVCYGIFQHCNRQQHCKRYARAFSRISIGQQRRTGGPFCRRGSQLQYPPAVLFVTVDVKPGRRTKQVFWELEPGIIPLSPLTCTIEGKTWDLRVFKERTGCWLWRINWLIPVLFAGPAPSICPDSGTRFYRPQVSSADNRTGDCRSCKRQTKP